MKTKKGQINVEYIISITLFIGLVSYVGYQLMQQSPVYLNAVRLEYIQSEGYQISELLINDVGYPSNWEDIWSSSPSGVKRFGLSEGTKQNLISVDKTTLLNTICRSNYQGVMNRLGVDTSNYQVSLVVKNDVSGGILLDCRPSQIVSRRDVANFRRVVALSDGNYGEVTIQVW